jgi:exonuclease VII small subunit
MNDTICSKITTLENAISILNSSSDDLQQSLAIFNQCSTLSNEIKQQLNIAEKIFNDKSNEFNNLSIKNKTNSDDDIFDDDMFIDSDNDKVDKDECSINNYLTTINNLRGKIITENNIENVLQYYSELVNLLKNIKCELNKDRNITYV